MLKVKSSETKNFSSGSINRLFFDRAGLIKFYSNNYETWPNRLSLLLEADGLKSVMDNKTRISE